IRARPKILKFLIRQESLANKPVFVHLLNTTAWIGLGQKHISGNLAGPTPLRQFVEHRDNRGLFAVDRALRNSLLAPSVAIIAHVITGHGIDIAARPSLFHESHVPDKLLDAFRRWSLLAMQLEESIGGIFQQHALSACVESHQRPSPLIANLLSA